MIRDLIIIGGGPGGYETALYARKNGLKVLVIEKDRFGGTCLNVGCIPTKVWRHAAVLYGSLKKAEEEGIKRKTSTDISVDVKRIKERKDEVVRNLAGGISLMLRKAGVETVQGTAEIIGNQEVKVGETVYEGRAVIIASGSSDNNDQIKGFEHAIAVDELLDRESLPGKLLIIGGGVVGAETASVFRALGSDVTIVEGAETILPKADREISRRLTRIFRRNGIRIFPKTLVTEIREEEVRALDENGKEIVFTADAILLAVGRKPNIEDLGLDKAGVAYTKKGIVVNSFMETNVERIYAIGDVNGLNPLAHAAVDQGRIAVDRFLGKPYKTYFCPSAVFTLPEIAFIGKTEEELRAGRCAYEIRKIPYHANGKAWTIGETEGFVKIIMSKGFIVGAHVIGCDASSLIHQIMIIMNAGISVDEAKNYIFAHPTLSELLKEVFSVTTFERNNND